MKRALLDTDVFSEVLKGRNSSVAAIAKTYRAAYARFTISAVTVMEIIQGLHKKGHAAAITRFAAMADTLEVQTNQEFCVGRSPSRTRSAGSVCQSGPRLDCD